MKSDRDGDVDPAARGAAETSGKPETPAADRGKADSDKGADIPAAGPHAKAKNVDESKTPGSGALPEPGSNDPSDMAPTG